MSGKPDKPAYAPIPLRAAGDKNLTAEGLRVLAVIAGHDRLGANGIGCYAGHDRIAELASCEFHSLSRTLKALVASGYIEADRHPLNARLRVYRVLYTEFDATYFQGGKTRQKVSSPANLIVSNPATENGRIVSKPILETKENQRDGSVNIFRETGIYAGEPEGIHPVETAPLTRRPALEGAGSKSVGAMLGMLERSIKAGDPSKLPRAYEYLNDLVGEGDKLHCDDPNYRWAERLFNEVGEALP